MKERLPETKRNFTLEKLVKRFGPVAGTLIVLSLLQVACGETEINTSVNNQTIWKIVDRTNPQNPSNDKLQISRNDIFKDGKRYCETEITTTGKATINSIHQGTFVGDKLAATEAEKPIPSSTRSVELSLQDYLRISATLVSFDSSNNADKNTGDVVISCLDNVNAEAIRIDSYFTLLSKDPFTPAQQPSSTPRTSPVSETQIVLPTLKNILQETPKT